MYRVLLIDDEERNLLLLRKILCWEDYGFTVCAQATDGEEGLRAWREQRPDLIIVDIRMPVMDGLEFMRRLRLEDSDTCLIILSAYDEFDYAREAIRQGAADYLLKPVDRKKLACAVDRAREALRQRDELRCRELCEALRRAAADAEEGRASFPLTRGGPWLLGMLVGECELPQESCSFERDGCRFLLAGSAEELRRAYERQDACPCFLMLSREFTGAEGFRDEYLRLREREYLGFYAQQSEVFPPEAASGFTSVPPDAADAEDVRRFVLGGGAEDLVAGLRGRFSRFAEDNVLPQLVMDFCVDLFAAVKGQMTQRYGERMFSILRHISLRELYAFHTAAGLRRFVCTNLLEAAEQMAPLLGQRRVSAPVDKALDVTRRHCFEPSFSVACVAQEVGLSKNYFLTLFHDETGQNFWDYVTELRMERARELLRESSCSVGEISGRVGYESPFHFSRKFKERVGQSPNEYKKSIRYM